MEPTLPEKLRFLVHDVTPRMVEFRRLLHSYPELSLQEFETRDRIRKQLETTIAEILPARIGTDVVALLHGKRPGPNITLRADMDALPIDDQCGKPWQSRPKGISHSCGHDGHMAMLTGAALVLNDITASFKGSVRFVFQPAEEQSKGGKGLIEKGLLDEDPRPNAVFALHGWPELPVGTFSARSGVYMAAIDRFTITIKGLGGHGAKPHLALNPILPAVQIVQAIQAVTTQSINPLFPAVISVCQFHAGSVDNVIPGTAVLSGTVRYFEPSLKNMIRERLQDVVHGCSKAAGVKFEFEYRDGCIPLVNNPEMTARARKAITHYLGAKAWRDNLELTTSSEDFSFYLEKIPGAFIRIGLGETSEKLHTSRFDFNDQALEFGIIALCALVLEILHQ